jgi:AcrR family transcriptional regulator
MQSNLLPINTREKIINSTIELFLSKGYEAVSMRDIAKATGIKASSIYNHFQNKEQIIDEVLLVFRDHLARNSVNDYRFDFIDCNVPNTLLHIMTAPLKLFEDPYLVKIIGVVTEGQHHHKGISDFLIYEMFDKPLNMIKTTLAKMIDQNLIQPLPVSFLATELQSVFIASFYRHSLIGDITNINLAEIREGIRLHVDFFYSAIKI